MKTHPARPSQSHSGARAGEHSGGRSRGGGRWSGCETLPSPEQRHTLTVLAYLTLHMGEPPTLRQLAEALGCSRPAAHYRLYYLEKKGYWTSRFWALTRAGVDVILRPLMEREDSVSPTAER
jgi:hypothetical protein